MSTFSRNLDQHKVLLFNVEARLRNNYRRIATNTKKAIEKWLDKKTSPYVDGRTVKR